MKITFNAKIVVDSPEHVDMDEKVQGQKYPCTLTYSETKKLIDRGMYDVEMIMPIDREPTFIFTLK